jgi:hypothetical protein
MVTASPWLRRGGVGAGPVQVSRGGETIAAQAPSAADVSTISVAATQVAAAAASFNETDCYAIKYSATCYPSSQYIPPPEPWDEWVSWGQAVIGYLQNAVAAAENAAAAASRVAASNQAAYYSAQSANSSVGAAQQMLPGIQAQLAASGWTWQSADGSTGKYPLCASYKVNKEEDFIFSPTPSFVSSISQALQDCSGAVSYAQQAVKLAQAAMPTPAPSEVSRMSFSSIQRDMLGAPVQVSRGGEAVSASAQAAAQLQQQKNALAAQINQAAANLQNAWNAFQQSLGWSTPDCSNASSSGTTAWVTQAIGYAKAMQAAANVADNVATAMTQLVKTQAAINDAQAASAAHLACSQAVAALPTSPVPWRGGWFAGNDNSATGTTYNSDCHPDPGGPGVAGVTQAYQYAGNAIAAAMNALGLSAPAPTTSAETARTSFSSIQRDMLGAPVQVSRGGEIPHAPGVVPAMPTPPPTQGPSPCEAWTLGETVFVGQTIFQALQVIPAAVSQLAASGRIGEAVTYLIDGGWYHFQPSGKQVAIYYCSRSPVQVSRPEGPRPPSPDTWSMSVGSSGVGQGPGEQAPTPSATPNASPAATQPPATTGASNAATTGVVTGSLIATAVVFTLVAWSLEKGLDKVFSSKK